MEKRRERLRLVRKPFRLAIRIPVDIFFPAHVHASPFFAIHVGKYRYKNGATMILLRIPAFGSTRNHPAHVIGRIQEIALFPQWI